MRETVTVTPMAYRSMLSWCQPFRSCYPWSDDTTPRTNYPVQFRWTRGVQTATGFYAVVL